MKGSDILQDSQIIELFFERSEKALTELSSKYEKLCKTISYNILSNEEDSSECINDSYLAVWNTIPPKRPENLKNYLCRIVRNNALKRYNANMAIKRNSSFDISLNELEECLPDVSSVEESLSLTELALLIDKFLEKQKTENRIVFVRRYFYGDSISDIALRMDTSENNISVKLNRLRKALKNHLAKEGVEI